MKVKEVVSKRMFLQLVAFFFFFFLQNCMEITINFFLTCHTVWADTKFRLSCCVSHLGLPDFLNPLPWYDYFTWLLDMCRLLVSVFDDCPCPQPCARREEEDDWPCFTQPQSLGPSGWIWTKLCGTDLSLMGSMGCLSCAGHWACSVLLVSIHSSFSSPPGVVQGSKAGKQKVILFTAIDCCT